MATPTSSRLQRRRNFFKRLRVYAYLSGAVLLLIILIYLFVGSPLLKIQTINVASIEPVDEAAVVTALTKQVATLPAARWLGVDSYFAWPNDLTYTAPRIATIQLEKSFWARSITVSVVPRDRYAVWCFGEIDCAWVDSGGTLFELAPIAEGQLVQTIFETGTSSPALLGAKVLPEDSFEVVKKAISAVRSLNVSVAKVIINRDLRELYLDTAAGARIRLSLSFDPSPTAIPAIQRFAANPGFSKLEYLNLTVENRAFVKYR